MYILYALVNKVVCFSSATNKQRNEVAI